MRKKKLNKKLGIVLLIKKDLMLMGLSQHLKSVPNGHNGQAMVEYILTATLLFVGAYWGYHAFSGVLAGLFNNYCKVRTGSLGMGP